MNPLPPTYEVGAHTRLKLLTHFIYHLYIIILHQPLRFDNKDTSLCQKQLHVVLLRATHVVRLNTERSNGKLEEVELHLLEAVNLDDLTNRCVS